MIKKILHHYLLSEYKKIINDETISGDCYTLLCERLFVLMFIMRVAGNSQEIQNLYKLEVNRYYGNEVNKYYDNNEN